MKRRKNFFPVFFIFFFFSFLVFVGSKTGVLAPIQAPLEKIISPVRDVTFSFFTNLTGVGSNNQVEDLKNENRDLRSRLVRQDILEKDISAFKDQFETANPAPGNLIPAKVVGMVGFVPGISKPESLILDKGTGANIKIGQAVVFKDNAVGKVVDVSLNLSRVDLVTNNSSSFIVRTKDSGAIGVANGQGNGEIILDNVILSDNLKISDLVVTSGSIDISGLGYPPNLIVGKIVSVDKKPSALFQKGSLKSSLDFSRLSTVFVILGGEK